MLPKLRPEHVNKVKILYQGGMFLCHIPNMFSEKSCERLIEKSPKLDPAKIITPGEDIIDVYERKCDTGWLKNETVLDDTIEHYIDWPLEYTEKYSYIKYGVGGYFRPHHDWIHTPVKFNRNATLIVYLKTPEKGGQTIFPELNVSIEPEVGDAVFFSYDGPGKSMHAGSPVKKGEKMIITKWFREAGYTST